MTRAKDHLVFAGDEEPNTFLEELPVDIETVDPSVGMNERDDSSKREFRADVPVVDGPEGYSPHSLMDDSVYDDVTEGRGMEFGSDVHEFAEAYVLGEEVTADNDDEQHIKTLIDSLPGEFYVEERTYLPLETEHGDVTISGVADLVHVTSDRAEIIDFKTDLSRHAEPEYRKQLSVYYHVLNEWFPDHTVSASIFYTAEGDRATIDPISREDLCDLIDFE